MTTNKRLLHFKNKNTFEIELSIGNILDTSIAFILSTGEIWTHGLYYATRLSVEEIEQIIDSSETIQELIEQVAKVSVIIDEVNTLSTYHKWSILDVSTFSINGTSYEFEEGMTWRDWIYSDYYQETVLTLNIGSTETIQLLLESVSGNVTLYNTAGLQYSPSINSDDLIISNLAYITQMMEDQQL